PTVNAGGRESGTVGGLVPGATYHLAVRARNAEGQQSNLSNAVTAATTAPVGVQLAIASRAQPRHPPIPLAGRRGGVARQTIAIYDLGGRLRRRFDVTGATGQVMWDGVDRGGELLESGVYFVRMTSGGAHARARLVLIR